MAQPGDGPFDRYQPLVREILGDLADPVLNDRAWPALGRTLQLADDAGIPLAPVLQHAMTTLGDLERARSVAALLTWQIQQNLQQAGTPTIPPARTAATNTTDTATTNTATNTAASVAAETAQPPSGRAAQARMEPLVRQVLGNRANRVLTDNAYPLLVRTLGRAEQHGVPAHTALTRAAGQIRDIDAARSAARLLAWQINQNLGPEPAPATRTEATIRPQAAPSASARDTAATAPASPPAAQPSTPPDAAREDSRPQPLGWASRPHGHLLDAELAERLAASRTDGIAYGRLAREARQSAQAQQEAAISRNGPNARAVAARYEQLRDRAQAIDALARLDRSYADLRQQEQQARRVLVDIQERLAERRFGLHAVRGQAREELVADADRNTAIIDSAPQRLLDLDRQRADLEQAAGPAHTRHADYTAWLALDAEWPHPLDRARTADIEDAQPALDLADQLEQRAADHAIDHDALEAEAALRAVLPADRQVGEEEERVAHRIFAAINDYPSLNDAEAVHHVYATDEELTEAQTEHEEHLEDEEDEDFDWDQETSDASWSL